MSKCYVRSLYVVYFKGALNSGEPQALLSKIAGVIIVVFGLHLTRLLPIKFLYIDRHVRGISGGSTAIGAFVVGFSFGFGWTPYLPTFSLRRSLPFALR